MLTKFTDARTTKLCDSVASCWSFCKSVSVFQFAIHWQWFLACWGCGIDWDHNVGWLAVWFLFCPDDLPEKNEGHGLVQSILSSTNFACNPSSHRRSLRLVERHVICIPTSNIRMTRQEACPQKRPKMWEAWRRRAHPPGFCFNSKSKLWIAGRILAKRSESSPLILLRQAHDPNFLTRCLAYQK